MDAFDAPEGPLKGSGTLAVHVLTWTMRPRALRNAGRKALMTERAPNTLTSNSRRMAASGRTSIGPGVRMPALLIKRSRPASLRASDTALVQDCTAASCVMSQIVSRTWPAETPANSRTPASDEAEPHTAQLLAAKPSANPSPRPPPAPMTHAAPIAPADE